MTNMQAAIGLAQLENISWHMEQRKRVAGLYKKYLGNLGEYMKLQDEPENYKHVYWMSNVILQDMVTKSRDEVMNEMETYNIEMRPVFYPMHIMPPYFDNNATYPIAEKLASRGISLSSHAMLTEEDVAYICNCLKKIVIE